jgi:hypothetical protein
MGMVVEVWERGGWMLRTVIVTYKKYIAALLLTMRMN